MEQKMAVTAFIFTALLPLTSNLVRVENVKKATKLLLQYQNLTESQTAELQSSTAEICRATLTSKADMAERKKVAFACPPQLTFFPNCTSLRNCAPWGRIMGLKVKKYGKFRFFYFDLI